MGLIDQIIGAESGGDPNASNPRSSASGLGQFIDSTWLDMLSKHRPDLTGSREQLLALRSDPDLSRAMTEAYAAENGSTLSKAGHEATPGNTYLAHFAGPQGAISVLNANPSAPVGQVLGARVVQANPFLANMTVGDLRAWADKKMGGRPAGESVPPQAASAPPMQIAPMGGAPAPAQSQLPPIYYARTQQKEQPGPPLDLASFRQPAFGGPSNMPAFPWSPGQGMAPQQTAQMPQAPPIQYYRPQMQAFQTPLRRGFSFPKG